MKLKLARFLALLNELHYQSIRGEYFQRLGSRVVMGVFLFVPIAIVAGPAVILFSLAGKSRNPDLLYNIGGIWLLMVLAIIILTMLGLMVFGVKKQLAARRYARDSRPPADRNRR